MGYGRKGSSRPSLDRLIFAEDVADKGDTGSQAKVAKWFCCPKGKTTVAAGCIEAK